MKKLFYPIALLLLSCNSQEDSTEIEKEVEDETIQPIEIYGSWILDSSSYMTNEIKNITTPPLLPTTWEFKTNGNYIVRNSVEMPGTFSVTPDSLFVDLMGVPNNYQITLMTDTNLILRSTITQNDTALIQTEAYLTRKK